MKRALISSAALASLVLGPVMSLPASAQEEDLGIEFRGTHPPDPGVLQLIMQYSAAGEDTMQESGVDARDEARKDLSSKGYFYHGMDGSPIGFEGLNERQNKNGLRIHKTATYDAVLYQYENVAIGTYKTLQSGEDRGEAFEDLRNSAILVMAREGDEWVVVSDIIGAQPAPPMTSDEAADAIAAAVEGED